MKDTKRSLPMIVALLTAAFASSAFAGINNGDFSSGLSGWTMYLPPGNSLGPTTEIAPIDIDGAGPLGASDAFHAAVGWDALLNLQQDVLLTGGLTYNFHADLAMTPPGNNADGGTVSVYLGPTLLASYGFGGTTYAVTEYGSLSGSYQPASSGVYTLSINFSRGYGFSPGFSAVPSDWIDNVQLNPVPEPGSATMLLGAGGLWLFFRKRNGTATC